MRSIPSTASTAAQELGERHPVVSAQVAPVGVHVLAEQRDLADAVAGEALDLGEQLGAGRD